MIRLRPRAASLALVLGLGGCLAIEPDPPEGTAEGPTGGPPPMMMPTGGSTGMMTGGETAATDDGPERTSDGGPSDGGSSGGGGPDGVGCDMAVCLPPEVCCAAMAGSACSETCSDSEVAQNCDGPEDCGGQLCCFGLTAGSVCADACEGLTPEIACHADADCPGGACIPHPFVPWFSTCE